MTVGSGHAARLLLSEVICGLQTARRLSLQHTLAATHCAVRKRESPLKHWEGRVSKGEWGEMRIPTGDRPIRSAMTRTRRGRRCLQMGCRGGHVGRGGRGAESPGLLAAGRWPARFGSSAESPRDRESAPTGAPPRRRVGGDIVGLSGEMCGGVRFSQREGGGQRGRVLSMRRRHPTHDAVGSAATPPALFVTRYRFRIEALPPRPC